MNDKLKNYYSLIDVYEIDNKDAIFFDDDDPIEEIFFKQMLPINTCLIVRYLEPIINDICKRVGSEEKAKKEINNLINLFKANSDEKSLKEYKNEDITLLDCLKGDYNFLKKKFIIEDRYVPDINYFLNNYTYPETTLTYPFSIKELYNMIVERGLKILVHNFFVSNK